MLLEKLKELEKKYGELSNLLATPEVISDQARYQRYARELALLKDIVKVYSRLKKIEEDIKENRDVLEGKNEELKPLAKEELAIIEKENEELSEKLKILLLPKDPNDERNIIVEIRAGAGGDESALFAAELFRMYSRYAERHGWETEVLSSNATGLNGYKEIIAMIEGRGAYSRLKYESGVHRVQRVPATEAGGRIHTSTVTVAVIPEAEEVDVPIGPEGLRIDVFRSSR